MSEASVNGTATDGASALPADESMLSRLFSLRGRTAVVTGACGLIGREHCRALLGAHASLVAVDLSAQQLDALVETLRAEFGPEATVIGVATDITDRASVERLRDRVLAELGSIDVLVNNAAINDMFESPAAAGEQSKFENYPLELWQKSLDVNVTGTFLCSQILGSEMTRHGRGSIVNVASTYGVVAPDQSIYRRPDGSQAFFKTAAYPVTKGAVISFTRFLAAYWGGSGVRVNTLSPGGVENGQDEYFIGNYAARTPLGRMAQPTDYRGALLFLASDASSYMTGANLIVDGGWTCW
jgi:NAD(P)-dependent dehydrogenase (short-subunit alcohol dehydrogenase family)